METIKNYLDNLFASFPKTKEIVNLKSDLLASMEEKYYELKDGGKTENEAIGIVISEFGNIDELIEELDIQSDTPYVPLLPAEEAEEFLHVKKVSGKWIGIATFMCLTGVAVLILMLALSNSQLLSISNNASTMAGLIIMLAILAPAIGIFIYTGVMLEPYQHIEYGVTLSSDLYSDMIRRRQADLPAITIGMIIGICLIILSPIVLFTALFFNGDLILFGVAALLITVGVGIAALIYFSTLKTAYNALLQEEKYSVESKKGNKVIGAVASVVWPLVICIFLISGLVFHQWHINWIIFPITGILFGMFCSLYNIIKGKEID